MLDSTIDQASTGRLAHSQAIRRERVLEAVLDLANEGGYDAIQLRAVQDRTSVSTDTIYRYFTSRDQLIASALVLWTDRELHSQARAWVEGATPGEQLLSFERKLWGLWERNPNILETWVRAALAQDPSEDGLAGRSLRELLPILMEILHGIDSDYRDDMLMMIQHTSFSTMTHVVRGELEVHDAFFQIERTIVLLAQHPAMDGFRPKSWDWRPRSNKRHTPS